MTDEMVERQTRECDYEHWRSPKQWKRGECFLTKWPCNGCATPVKDEGG